MVLKRKTQRKNTFCPSCFFYTSSYAYML